MTTLSSSPFLRVAGWCAYISATVSAFGVVFLVIFFVGFFSNNMALHRFGSLNDVCIIIQYLLTLPVLLALHQTIRPHTPQLSKSALLIGICGIGVVVIFHILLVAEVMTVNQQVGYASAGLLMVGTSILIFSFRLHATQYLQNGRLVGVLGFCYVGYPVWAFTVARLLLWGKQSPTRNNLSLSGETV